MDATAIQIAHLCRRAGFSCSADELDRKVQQGLDATIDEFIHYENAPEIPDLFDPSTKSPATLTLVDIQTFWLHRMIHSPRQLQEKMTLFWHGHFATGQFKVKNPTSMLTQNRMFRANALAGFRTILQGVSRDPAMLVWLDNVSNTKRAPNENYAREVMELFTMGRGNYSEEDVKAGAHAFSGWGVKNGRYWVNVRDHDFSTKQFLGHTGRFNGDEIIDILVSQPATAKYIAAKLLRFFATDTPDNAWVFKTAQVFSQTNGDIRKTVEAIFRSDEFYSPSVMQGRYKSPAEYVTSAVRELNASINLATAANHMSQMGQTLFNPPSVKGWDAGRTWINTATLLARINFAGYLASSRSGILTPGALTDLFNRAGVNGASDAITAIENRLGGLQLASETRAPIAQYLDSTTQGIKGPFAVTPKGVDVKARNAIRLVMSSPEYQFN